LQWLQVCDEIAQEFGYRYRNMCERYYYFMSEDLKKLDGERIQHLQTSFAASEKLPPRPAEVDPENCRRVAFYLEDWIFG
jgi:hypothetical protein